MNHIYKTLAESYLRLFGVGQCPVPDAQLTDLAGDCIATYSEPTRRLDASSSGMREGLRDQRFFEALREIFHDVRFAVYQSAIRFACQRRDPLAGGRCGILAELRRKITDLDDLRGGHHGEPVTHIFELTDVSGKILSREGGHRRIRQTLGFYTELPSRFCKEVSGKQGNIFAAFAQRGEP